MVDSVNSISFDISLVNPNFIPVGHNEDCDSDAWVASFPHKKIMKNKNELVNFLRYIASIEIKGKCFMYLGSSGDNTGCRPYAIFMFTLEEDEAHFRLGFDI